MTIRRNRTPPITGRLLTSTNSLITDEISAATASSSSRYRNKRFSVPVATRGGGAYDGGISALDLNAASEDIERRRRRIRSICNSAPPIPVPSIYRGYLPKSTSYTSSSSSANSMNDSSSHLPYSSSRTANGTLTYHPNILRLLY